MLTKYFILRDLSPVKIVRERRQNKDRAIEKKNLVSFFFLSFFTRKKKSRLHKFFNTVHCYYYWAVARRRLLCCCCDYSRQMSSSFFHTNSRDVTQLISSHSYTFIGRWSKFDKRMLFYSYEMASNRFASTLPLHLSRHSHPTRVFPSAFIKSLKGHFVDSFCSSLAY